MGARLPTDPHLRRLEPDEAVNDPLFFHRYLPPRELRVGVRMIVLPDFPRWGDRIPAQVLWVESPKAPPMECDTDGGRP